MYSSNEIRDYIAHYDGYLLQSYLLENIDLIGYVVAFYLVFVGKGQPILRWLCGRRRSADKARVHTPYTAAALNRFFVVSCLYHVTVSAIALACTVNLFPTLLHSFEHNDIYATLCTWNDNLIYKGPMGFWVSICVFAKIADLVDSCLLVVRNYMASEMSTQVRAYVGSMRQVSAAHWWFRSLMALLWWHTFSIGISTFPTLALVDVACHVVIHTAHVGADLLSFVPSTLTKTRGDTPSVSILHKLLNLASTLALLVECVVCTVIAVYSSYMNYTAADGCHVVQANVRMYLVVFVGTVVLAVARLGAASAAHHEAAAEETGDVKASKPAKPHNGTPSKGKKKQ